MYGLSVMRLVTVLLVLGSAFPAFSADLEARVSVLESRPRPVLVDANAQEVGPLLDANSVVLEINGAVLLLTPERGEGWNNAAGQTSFHLAADCADDPKWLKDAEDPLASSSYLFDFAVLTPSQDLWVVDDSAEPEIIWDPAEQGSLPTVYRAYNGNCAPDGFLSSPSNRQLTWYLIPLRSVLNLNEAYPPPLHVELRPSGEPFPVQAGCGLGSELALLLPALWLLRRRLA